MQEKKKAREVKRCPEHGTVLRKRRGTWSKRWILYCTECSHQEYVNAT